MLDGRPSSSNTRTLQTPKRPLNGRKGTARRLASALGAVQILLAFEKGAQYFLLLVVAQHDYYASVLNDHSKGHPSHAHHAHHASHTTHTTHASHASHTPHFQSPTHDVVSSVLLTVNDFLGHVERLGDEVVEVLLSGAFVVEVHCLLLAVVTVDFSGKVGPLDDFQVIQRKAFDVSSFHPPVVAFEVVAYILSEVCSFALVVRFKQPFSFQKLFLFSFQRSVGL
jgi:hypothetical protein